jgi:subtilisin family serine protease
VRIAVRLLAAGAAALVFASPAAAAVTPTLEQAIQSAAPDQQLAIVVTMADQLTVPALPNASRADRTRAVERALRSQADASQASIRRDLGALRRAGEVSRVEPLWIVNALAVSATPVAIRTIAALPGVASVDLDASGVKPADTSSAPAEANIAVTGAPSLWAAGFSGQGVVVASLDTGVDATHPDLSASWRGGSNSWFDPNGEHPSVPTDVSGHGTQTMGVMVGGSAGGSTIGMAPGARWIAAKIFNDRGLATTSGIHKAFQWVLDPDGNAATTDGATVVNNSWTAASIGCDLTYEPDLRNLRAAGVLPVFAAGNSGPDPSTSTSPANNPDGFAVGATDGSGQVASFSSRGPAGCGEAAGTFPELVAPGVGIRSSDLFHDWISSSGTSLAAPHVAGALALLASAYPGASADRQASALEAGAGDLGAAGPDNDFGFGELNVPAALDWLRTAPDFSVTATPSAATTAAGGTVNYTIGVSPINGFTGDVALSFSGLDSSQATVRFSSPTVPGGSGSSQLSVTTAAGLSPGSYPLRVIATAGVLTRSVAVTLQVSGPPDFKLDATPPASTVSLGGTASYTVSVLGQNNFTGSATLVASGVPGGARATFSVNPVKAGGSSVMRVTTTGATRRATYTLTVTGTSGSLVRRTTVSLTVR